MRGEGIGLRPQAGFLNEQSSLLSFASRGGFSFALIPAPETRGVRCTPPLRSGQRV